MIRAFIAIELPADFCQALGQVQARLRQLVSRATSPDVRVQWVKPGTVHLTVKFLGDIDEAQVPSIQRALAHVASTQQAFTVTVQGLGVFPDVRAPRVVWVGCASQGQALQELAAAVEAALETLGFPVESKPFSPHLTLARVKERGRDVGRALEASRLLEQRIEVGTLPVNAMALIRSELKPSGAVYTKLCDVPLKEA